MKINLEEGTFIQVGGEMGKYNSLPIDYLVRIASFLQELVLTLAKYDLPSDDQINLDNFKIELIDFKKGSAVPEFAFSPRSESKTGQNWQIHRSLVNTKFEQLLEISDDGDYSKIKELYPDPFRRNIIVGSLYDFTNSFGTAPVSFVNFDKKEGKIIPIYSIKKFKPAVRDSLVSKIKEINSEDSLSGEGVAKMKYYSIKGKIKRKIMDVYTRKNISIEYAPEVIVANERKYILTVPLRCLFEKEHTYYLIQNELLNIIGTGKNEDEAEQAFGEEFDHMYRLLNELNDNSLTERNKQIKSFFDYYIQTIEE